MAVSEKNYVDLLAGKGGQGTRLCRPSFSVAVHHPNPDIFYPHDLAAAEAFLNSGAIVVPRNSIERRNRFKQRYREQVCHIAEVENPLDARTA